MPLFKVIGARYTRTRISVDIRNPDCANMVNRRFRSNVVRFICINARSYSCMSIFHAYVHLRANC